MSRVISWLNTPAPPRKRWLVIFSSALDGAVSQLHNQRITELERRIEALERKS